MTPSGRCVVSIKTGSALGFWLVIALTSLAALSSIPGSAAARDCETPLTGRALNVESVPAPGFGVVQGLPPLPLRAGEYVISIDDGPDAATTPALLDILDRYCVKASFFLVGRRAEAQPGLAGAIAARGHAIGNHSYRHPDLGKLSEEGIVAEMRRGAEAVDAALRKGGSPPARLMRLPGSANFPPVPPAGLLRTLAADGFLIAGYDLSPQDWRNAPPRESFGILFRHMKDRGVIVFHDGQSNTVALLPMVLDELMRRGAKIVQLAQERGVALTPEPPQIAGPK